VVLVHTALTLLIPAFALRYAPPVLAVWLLCVKNAPLPYLFNRDIHGFGGMLEPRYVLGACALDQ
jgi:hypothetical protein